MESADEHRTAKNAIFLNNLEQWIDDVIMQDGLTDDQIVVKVTGSFQRSMQANVDFHEKVANDSGSDGNKRRHKILVEIYKQLKGSYPVATSRSIL